mmetsp:Transcript_64569/g.158945  ORF Transcript_64569/g.158945 Transcript_64569/m.158945 type:complete len:256 (-) Transcript_64569:1076-1843(-)
MLTISSALRSSSVASLRLQPLFLTSRLLTTTLAPRIALITRAPSTCTLPSNWMSPSSSTAELALISTSAPLPIRSFTSVTHVPKAGESTHSGANERGTPAYVPFGPSSGIFTPAMRSILVLRYMASRSAVPAHSGGRPLEALAAASTRLFLTGEKHSHLSSWVKPTGASGGRRRGKSCIMHSRRVGFLKVVLDASAYFGLTNSFMTPLVLSSVSAYRFAPNTRMLMFPGKGEQPVFGSATSPPLYFSVERRRESN